LIVRVTDKLVEIIKENWLTFELELRSMNVAPRVMSLPPQYASNQPHCRKFFPATLLRKIAFSVVPSYPHLHFCKTRPQSFAHTFSK
jgi:hypothetical protein